MNEEEKQAVKDFEDLLKKHFEETSVTSFNFLEGVEGIHILNIIKKQQKEIEEIDKKFQFAVPVDVINDLYISKDKIKEKIKELESHIWKDGYMTKFDKYAIHYLKELLGE